MPGYSTVTGENDSTVSMGTGTSLFRKLLSVGSGFTITGFDLTVSFDGEASAAAAGLITGVPYGDLDMRWAISYGPSVFTPSTLLANPDDPALLWWSAGEERFINLVVPATTTSQQQTAYRIQVRSRYQFRLAAASDFCLQIGNASAVTTAFRFIASLRVSYA